MDRRVLPALVAGLAGFASGNAAVVFHLPVLAALAGTLALLAAAASAVMSRPVAAGAAAFEPSRLEAPQTSDARHARPSATATLAGAGTLLDPATGLPDERVFELELGQRLAAARRRLWPMTVVVLNVDGSAQDLWAVAAVLRETLRACDLVCRLGPTTFGLVLEDTDDEGGVFAVERLQVALGRRQLARVAGGVASYPKHGADPAALFAAARAALDCALDEHDAFGLGQIGVAPADPG